MFTRTCLDHLAVLNTHVVSGLESMFSL